MGSRTAKGILAFMVVLGLSAWARADFVHLAPSTTSSGQVVPALPEQSQPAELPGSQPRISTAAPGDSFEPSPTEPRESSDVSTHTDDSVAPSPMQAEQTGGGAGGASGVHAIPLNASTGGSSTVPEPSALALLTIASAGLLARRRR